jgi:uncharacterized protein YbjQ (UPF0145 family)
MGSCYLSTCPQSHHRLRDALRGRWSWLVSEWSPLWAVSVGGRPAIVAPTSEHLVVVGGGLRDPRTIRFEHVTEATAADSVVHLAYGDGYSYALAFADAQDAVTVARLITERRANAARPQPVVAFAQFPPAAVTDLAEFATRDLMATAELPIEREVAWLLARSGGASIGPPDQVADGAVPAQIPKSQHGPVLLVTTDQVPGRAVVAVHGEVLGLASPPEPCTSASAVHDLARARLVQAALRRGANAVIGMRYWASAVVRGDVGAYGTAVTLGPAEQSSEREPSPAAGGNSVR